MAGPFVADRVRETSITTGTGTFNLDGAVDGHQTFVAGIGTTNTCFYVIAQQDLAASNEWECGIGTVTDATPDTLSRDTVVSSSNAGSLVVFSAGTKDVFVSLISDGSNALNLPGIVTNGAADLTGGTVTLGTVIGAIDAGGATSLEIPNSATPTVNADGEIALDTTVTDFSHGIIRYYGGEELFLVGMPVAQLTTPSDGFVVAYNATNDEFELVAQTGVVPSGSNNQLITDDGAGGIVSEANLTFDGSTLTVTGASNLSAGTTTLGTVAGTIDAGGATSLEIPNSATPTVNADGEIALDTTVTDFSHGIIRYYGGEECFLVAMPVAQLTTPTDGHVVAYNATNDEFELVAQTGGGGTSGSNNEILTDDGAGGIVSESTLTYDGTTFSVSPSTGSLDMTTGANFGYISMGTSDATDNHLLAIGGGGAANNNARGGGLLLSGNEHSGTGKAYLDGGDVAGASAFLRQRDGTNYGIVGVNREGTTVVGANSGGPTAAFTSPANSRGALAILEAPDGTPGTPTGNVCLFYVDSLGDAYVKDNSGTAYQLNAAAGSVAMADITDYTETTIGTGEVIVYTGAGYENQTLAEAGIAAASHTHNAATDLTGQVPLANGGTGADLSAGDGVLSIDVGSMTTYAQLPASHGGLGADASGWSDGVVILSAASFQTEATLALTRGGLGMDVSTITTGNIIAGTGVGTLGFVDPSAASDGDVLTLQADNTVAYEAIPNAQPSTGGTGQDFSASTGVITVNSGTFAAQTTLEVARGGLGFSAASVAIGDIIAGTGAGTMGLVTSTGHSDGDVLTRQADGSVDYEALPAIPSQATQAAIEAETNENTYAPPDLIKHSPGVAKFWVKFNGTGTIAIDDSYNVDSLTDNGTGDYTVTIDTDFSSADWCCIPGGSLYGTDALNTMYRRSAGVYSQAAGSVRVCTGYITASAAAVEDQTGVFVSGHGDQ